VIYANAHTCMICKFSYNSHFHSVVRGSIWLADLPKCPADCSAKIAIDGCSRGMGVGSAVQFWPCLIYIYLPIYLTIDRKAFAALDTRILLFFFCCHSVFQFSIFSGWFYVEMGSPERTENGDESVLFTFLSEFSYFNVWQHCCRLKRPTS